MDSQHLWDIETSWFQRPDSEYINRTFSYKSWKEFRDCKPYKLWKPYILSSWSWKMLVPAEILALRKQPRKDSEKTGADCRKQLRVNPSAYDSEPFEEPPTVPVDMLQIVFISPDRFQGLHRVEVRVSKEDEEEIRTWLKHHMPIFWKL